MKQENLLLQTDCTLAQVVNYLTNGQNGTSSRSKKAIEVLNYSVSKNDTDVSHYNYDIHEGIFLNIFSSYQENKQLKVALFLYLT